MYDFIEKLLRFYGYAKEFYHVFDSVKTKGSKKTAYHFSNFTELRDAIIRGDVSIGDYITGSAWLSTYAYWYLPEAYSPCRLKTKYLMENNKWAMEMQPSPAFLPAGQIPSVQNEYLLGFLYPVDSYGLSLELATITNNAKMPFQHIGRPEDQRWIFNLDTGNANFSANPELWRYNFGDLSTFRQTDNDDTGDISLLIDPKNVRNAVHVPNNCKPIPILIPKGICQPHQYVELTARLVELDKHTLDSLSHLGGPLAERVYSHFYIPETGLPAYCLKIDESNNTSVHASKSKFITTDTKLVTWLIEFYFEDVVRGLPITFDDNDMTECLIPIVKNKIYTLGGYVYPDRWIGKISGFDGPIYIFKTGPIEMSISPSGVYAIYVTVDITQNQSRLWNIFRTFYNDFRSDMIEYYKTRHKLKINANITYLTDYGWQMSFGQVLEGSTSRIICERKIQLQQLRKELQSIDEPDSSVHLAPIRAKFTKPIIYDIEGILSAFEDLKHNEHLLSLTKEIFNSLGFGGWILHDPKDLGTDHLIQINDEPKVTVSIQMKSHKEIVMERNFYDTVLAQRSRSSAYNADLYLIFLYGNTQSESLRQENRKVERKHGIIVSERFAHLKREIEVIKEFRCNTEVVSPESIAQVIKELNIKLENT